MNKLWNILFILLLVGLSGCTTGSFKDIHEAMSKDYKDVTIENYLERSAISLNYSHNQHATLVLFEGYYVIDFNTQITYLYHLVDKDILKYTSTLDESFNANAQSIIEFIHEVEKSEDIKFEKFSYLIFDVIRSALEAENKPYIQFNQNRANKAFYYPHLVIKKENFKYINKLPEILEDTNDDPQELKILMDKHGNSSIIIYPYGMDIYSHDNEALIMHLNHLIKNI